MNEHHLKIPLQEETVRGLHLGDIVYLSGITCLAFVPFHRRVAEMGIMPDIDLDQCNVLWLSGLVVKKQDDAWKVISAGVTTSIRFEKWAPAVIERLGLRAIIGKGPMGANTLDAMQRLGCVHLGTLGMVTGARNAQAIKEVVGVEWSDAGPPAWIAWLLSVENLGPFVVDMDCAGGMLYDKIYEEIDKEKLPKAYRMLGIEDFQYMTQGE